MLLAKAQAFKATMLAGVLATWASFFSGLTLLCSMMRIGHGQSFGVIGQFFHGAPLIFLIKFFTYLVKFGITTHILCNQSTSLKMNIFHSFQVFSILNRSLSINDNCSLTCSSNLHLSTGMENLQTKLYIRCHMIMLH